MENTELHHITIKGFKSIAHVEKLELRPINVVIGPNGSGKSNFIGVFPFLHSVREGKLQDYVRQNGGADQLLHFGSKVTESLSIQIAFKNGVNQYHLKLEPTSDDSLYPSLETVSFWNKAQYPEPYTEALFPLENGREAGISSESVKRTTDWVRTRLGRWRLYHVHDTSKNSPMRKTSNINDYNFLRPDGSNLPAFLYFLKIKHPDSYRMIRSSVQKVAPFFDDFVLEPDQLNEDAIRLIWKHKHSDKYFDASSLSDGTLRFIALTTLFLQPRIYKPSVILVDEPELGLHPKAISLLAALVKQASVETQVILSTQSPQLLDNFEPEDVLVVDRVNGGTSFTRLNTEQLSDWLEDYSLGQLWEKNELGGRPKIED